MNKRTLEHHFAQARAAFTIQDYESAENLAGQILKELPGVAPPRILLGIIYGNTGRFAESENEFKRALEIDPVNAEALNNLGCLYRQVGRLDEAEKALQKALLQAGERSDIHYNLGNVYKQMGDIDAAISEYTLSISYDPHFALAYNNLGTLFEDTDGHVVIALCSKLLQADGGSKTRRPGTDDHDIIFHRFALDLIHHRYSH